MAPCRGAIRSKPEEDGEDDIETHYPNDYRRRTSLDPVCLDPIICRYGALMLELLDGSGPVLPVGQKRQESGPAVHACVEGEGEGEGEGETSALLRTAVIY